MPFDSLAYFRYPTGIDEAIPCLLTLQEVDRGAGPGSLSHRIPPGSRPAADAQGAAGRVGLPGRPGRRGQVQPDDLHGPGGGAAALPGRRLAAHPLSRRRLHHRGAGTGHRLQGHAETRRWPWPGRSSRADRSRRCPGCRCFRRCAACCAFSAKRMASGWCSCWTSSRTRSAASRSSCSNALRTLRDDQRATGRIQFVVITHRLPQLILSTPPFHSSRLYPSCATTSTPAAASPEGRRVDARRPVQKKRPGLELPPLAIRELLGYSGGHGGLLRALFEDLHPGFDVARGTLLGLAEQASKTRPTASTFGRICTATNRLRCASWRRAGLSFPSGLPICTGGASSPGMPPTARSSPRVRSLHPGGSTRIRQSIAGHR